MAPSNIHEYIKLRQHFINLTLHADPECPLPSERTLAETFGVARKTVRRALEDMVAGNYLIKRPRRGYFVNPLSMREDERRQKIVGLLFRNGMHALYNREDACFMEAFFPGDSPVRRLCAAHHDLRDGDDLQRHCKQRP